MPQALQQLNHALRIIPQYETGTVCLEHCRKSSSGQMLLLMFRKFTDWLDAGNVMLAMLE